MPPTKIHAPPAASEYVTLAEYQTTTPESFADGRPVLHLHVAGAHAFVPPSHCDRLQVFEPEPEAAQTEKLARWTREHKEQSGESAVHEELDIFITSKNFILFNPRLSTGVSVPYTLISIHGIKKVADAPAVWIQLDLGNIDDDDYEPVELTVIQAPAPDAPTAAAIFQAIADCSDLNPDPNLSDEEGDDDDDRIVIEGSAEHEAIEGFRGMWRGVADGGLPPPMPGSGGWITADNVHEFFDEEGNWKGRGDGEGEELGEGAGRTRDRDELGTMEDGDAGDSESKRARVE